MIMPLMGLICSGIIFSILALVVLRTSRVMVLEPMTFLVFVTGCYPGVILYSLIFAAFIGDGSGQLTNSVAIITYLLGLPVSGTISGWASARIGVYVRNHLKRL